MNGEHGLVPRNVHRAKCALVRFRVGLLTLRAAETEQPVTMLSEALTPNIALAASHCCRRLFLSFHDSNIQLAIAVYQETIALTCSLRVIDLASPYLK